MPVFRLRGDEWQVDARVLKWHAFANLVGFDAAYRLERISGRYAHIEDERSQPRTVYDLHAAGRIDPWELVHRYRSWIPWMDALYGSATFLPMADGALYEIKVSQSGLIARPLNQAARDSVGSWHLERPHEAIDTHRKNPGRGVGRYCSFWPASPGGKPHRRTRAEKERCAAITSTDLVDQTTYSTAQRLAQVAITPEEADIQPIRAANRRP